MYPVDFLVGVAADDLLKGSTGLDEVVFEKGKTCVSLETRIEVDEEEVSSLVNNVLGLSRNVKKKPRRSKPVISHRLYQILCHLLQFWISHCDVRNCHSDANRKHSADVSRD